MTLDPRSPYGFTKDEVGCAFSIFVRVDIARIFRPSLRVHPPMIHPIES
jgi:hypothetical protein